ncbi:dihydrodipicolinate synthase family protein, partial [Rhodobacterales bacterium HKCCE2091]|nr:dihydrodipicolinate synthase family protein [Rhodobacterales bacterium HKCCE2091]MBF9036887.1 dihydrodipicolinate synthase family protein [Rhodobacterales bacterium HKCCE2091]
MIDGRTRGVFVISVTPFHGDGSIDWDSLDRVTEFYLEAG